MSKADLRKELTAFKKEHGEVVREANYSVCHLWQADKSGFLMRSGEHAGDGAETQAP